MHAPQGKCNCSLNNRCMRQWVIAHAYAQWCAHYNTSSNMHAEFAFCVLYAYTLWRHATCMYWCWRCLCTVRCMHAATLFARLVHRKGVHWIGRFHDVTCTWPSVLPVTPPPIVATPAIPQHSCNAPSALLHISSAHGWRCMLKGVTG